MMSGFGWVIGAAGGICALYAHSSAGHSDGQKPQIPEISSIRRWTKVNSTPLKMPTLLDALCREASASELAQTSANPHRQKYFTVYVNPTGKMAMLGKRSAVFPRGSVIVKAKLPEEDSRDAELLTAMAKREKGYFAEGGDWEYLVLDGKGMRVLESGRLKRCVSCHAQQKHANYVFRTYLGKADPARGRGDE
jgi:hypothetical protein